MAAPQNPRDLAQQLLDIAGVMLLTLDEKGIITVANKKACEVLGHPQDRIIGMN